MSSRHIAIVAAIAAFPLLSLPAMAADSITVPGTSTLGFQSVTITDSTSGFNVAGGGSSLSTEAGEIDGVIVTPPSATGVAAYLWCTDIQAFALEPGPGGYAVVGTLSAVTNLSSTVPGTYAGNTNHQSEVEALLGNGVKNINNFGVAQSVASAAIQSALWAILYEAGGSNGTGYSVTPGVAAFSISNNNAVATLANTLLGYVSCGYSNTCTTTNWQAGNYTLADYDPNASGLNSGGPYQSFVQVMQTSGGTTSGVRVPEPSSMALLGVGLLGLLGMRRLRMGA